MAVASALRIARHLNRDGAAVALPLVGLSILVHEFSFARVQGAPRSRGYSDQVLTSGCEILRGRCRRRTSKLCGAITKPGTGENWRRGWPRFTLTRKLTGLVPEGRSRVSIAVTASLRSSGTRSGRPLTTSRLSTTA